MRIRSNPLIEYLDFSTDKDREIMDYASRPLYSKNAPAVFAKKLKTVKLNIVIVIGKPMSKREKEYIKTLVSVNKYVVLHRIQTFKAVASKKSYGASNLWDEVFKDVPRGYVPGLKDVKIRLSPMTPFTVLHRFGDMCLPRLVSTHTYSNWGKELLSSSRPSILVSSGVDTLAGRSGWLFMIDEATSDLWAKYLLTGKIAYDSEAPPLDGTTWSYEELFARRKYKQYLDTLFPEAIANLQLKGGLFSI